MRPAAEQTLAGEAANAHAAAAGSPGAEAASAPVVSAMRAGTKTQSAGAGTPSPRRARFAPHTLFFPAAALYGALLLPWSVLAMLGLVASPATLSTAFGHAHEMLLGYALAVVAGYQLPPMTFARAAALFVLWVAARVAFVVLHGVGAIAFDAAFAIVLALHVAPRLFRAAKKIRNQGLPVILTALCLGAVAFDIALVARGAVAVQAIASAVVLLLTALMLFMGGRIIAPAAAGQRYRQGEALAARVQPRLEGTFLALMAVAVVLAVLPGQDALLRVACAGAGGVALVRLLRWRLWACRQRPDLGCLGAGYAWLAAGLLAVAASSPGTLRTAALHLITIGALGTLTLNVMAGTLLLKVRRPAAGEPILVVATVLVAAATLLRVAAALADGYAVVLLLLAAACWSAACIVALRLIVRSAIGALRRVPRPHEPA